jgi:hypothetical protein
MTIWGIITRFAILDPVFFDGKFSIHTHLLVMIDSNNRFQQLPYFPQLNFQYDEAQCRMCEYALNKLLQTKCGTIRKPWNKLEAHITGTF